MNHFQRSAIAVLLIGTALLISASAQPAAQRITAQDFGFLVFYDGKNVNLKISNRGKDVLSVFPNLHILIPIIPIGSEVLLNSKSSGISIYARFELKDGPHPNVFYPEGGMEPMPIKIKPGTAIDINLAVPKGFPELVAAAKGIIFTAVLKGKIISNIVFKSGKDGWHISKM